MKITYINLTLDHSDDSLFGSENPPKDYDANNLYENTRRKLNRHFTPNVEVNVTVSNHQNLDCDGDYHDIDTINHIIHDEWEKWIEKGF